MQGGGDKTPAERHLSITGRKPLLGADERVLLQQQEQEPVPKELKALQTAPLS